MSVYQTNIVNIGEDAKAFMAEDMIILFGSDAPEDLSNYCFNIDVRHINGKIKKGQKISFDNESYEITAVGEAVMKNLEELGHITIRFNGEADAELAGTLYVESKRLPDLSIGTSILIN